MALALVLALLGVSGCGGGAGTGSAPDGSTASSPLGRAASAAGVRRHPRFLVGDFDGDDYQAGGDADDDDSKHVDRDGDADSPTARAYDSDDASLIRYGHAASAHERRAVAIAVKRYLAAAGNLDGRAACSLMLARVAQEVPNVMGKPGSAPYEHGANCAQLVSSVFRFYRRQLETEGRSVEVAAVRIAGERSLALLAFKEAHGFPERVVTLGRERNEWRIDGVLDNEVP